MTARRPIFLLVNPEAGAKPGAPASLAGDPRAADPEALATELRARGLEVRMHVFAEGDDGGDLAREAADAGCDVVVAGGDGTVGAVAAALLGHPDATLGILARGSFNNVAHGIGIPVEFEPALDVIARGSTTAVDAGWAHHDDPAEGRPFFEAAGIGIDALGFVAVKVLERRGLWASLRAAWRGIRRRRTAVRVTIDGERYRVATPAVIVCNGPYFGLGFAVAPDADPTDGVLDVVIFRRMTTFRMLAFLLAVARHRPRREPRVISRRARTVTIEGLRRALPAHADGELVGITPVHCDVRPGALRVFR